MYVADGFGKIIEGTLIGSNLGNAVAAHTHTGFVFDGGIRDQEENREIPNFNGFYRGYDPSAWADMELTGINVPVRIGRAIVLPGDLVLAKPEGVLFIPAILAEDAISHAEFTSLTDDYNFELNREGKNGAQFEGGWTPAKYDAFAKWIDAHPEKLKMPRSEFDALLAKAKQPRPKRSAAVPELNQRAEAPRYRPVPARIDQRGLQHRLRVGDVVNVAGVAAAPGIAADRPAGPVVIKGARMLRDRSRASTSP